MTSNKQQRVHWLLFPFWIIWRFVIWVIEVTGRLIGAILGLVLLIVGVLLSLTVIGAIIGIPLIIFSIMLIIRSLL